MGAAMGFTPEQVRRMSLWEWSAVVNGYIEANSPKDAGKLSESEKDELFAWIDAPADLPEAKPLPKMVWDGEQLLDA